MTLNLETTKLKSLFNSVMNETLNIEDEKLVKTYLNSVFGKGRPSIHDLHQFNEVVVEQAEIIYQKQATDVLNILADVVRRPRPEAYLYKVPANHQAKWVWSANGTSVEHTRIGAEGTRTMLPTKISTGMYYEIDSLAEGDVNYFRELVRLVAEAKSKLFLGKVSELMQASIANGDVPAKNVLTGTNLTLAQYNSFANIFVRHGGRPVFVADSLLIDHLAFQQTTDTQFKELLNDDLAGELANALTISKIGRTTAVNLVNPFIVGTGNTQTELPVNEGYMFAAGAIKPVKLVEFGAMKQWTEFDSDLEQVQLKITQEYALDFVQGELIGYVQDDSITV